VTQFISMTRLMLALCLAALLAACSDSSSTPVEQPVESLVAISAGEAPIGQLDKSVVPLHYQIELRVDPSQDDFTGVTEIEISLTEPRDQIWLHGNGLQIAESWLVNAQGERIEASYEETLESGVALLTLARPVDAGPATLHFKYSAPFNTTTQALFKTERDDKFYATTQFQPIAAREVFPGFDDPGFKTPFDVSLVTRAEDVAVTNTPETATETLEDGFVRHTFDTSRPLPTYLIAFAVGPYDIADIGPVPPNSVRDWELPLRGIVASGQKERMTYALENTDGILTALEEYFGTPYPYKKLDLIAVPKSFGGAMENAGAITYDEYLILMDEQSALSQRRTYAAVHAHELAHMWFGDLVTPDWWTDIWLNESFATWMMYKAANTAWPEGEFDRQTLKRALGAMSNDSLASAREIREPIHQNEKIAGAFDGITYQKGGGVLAMLERYIGEEGFQKGIQLHMERHAEGSANADEFIASVSEGSGVSEVDAAFKSFIEQPGVPLVSAEVVCEEGEKPRLNVSQSRYAPLGSSIDPEESEWLVPMCVSYDTDGERKSTCAMLRERTQTIELDSDTCPSQLHPNADGAGYYRFTLSPSWLDGLIEGASTLSASEALVLADSLDASFRAGETSASSYVAGMGTLLNHPDWDVAEMAMDNLEIISDILETADQEQVLPALRRMVRPRFESLEGASDEGSELLQERMQRFLIVIARDPEMRAALAQQAASRIGLDGEPDPSAVPAGEMETVFSIGVQDMGEPFFDLLLEQGLASEDSAFRGAAFGALARVEDPELVTKLQSAVINGEFQGFEPVRIIFRQMARKATTELTFQWMKANDEALFELIPEARRATMVPGFGAFFCSIQKAEEWETFIVSRAELLPGYERDLAQATESVRLCAALKEARGADLMAALQAVP
jgi:alanyl aminopeptidase